MQEKSRTLGAFGTCLVIHNSKPRLLEVKSQSILVDHSLIVQIDWSQTRRFERRVRTVRNAYHKNMIAFKEEPPHGFVITASV